MRALQFFDQNKPSLIADYAFRMGDSMVRKKAEIEVRAARVEAELAIKARSEFLANMNHELRTPLNAIIGFASMLREGDQYALSDEQRDNYCEYILQSADLLLGHINTLLEVAALESGGVELTDSAIDFGAMLSEQLEAVRVRARAAQVTIERRDEGDLIEGWGDPERTGQAVVHLLQTAIKSCGENGRILARACLDEKGWAEIAIRDDGDGFTDDEIAEALEAFSEMHRGLDRSFSGPGVGYAVAKTFVEMQGGKFSIKSRKGKGTLVRIALPLPAKEPKNIDTSDGAQKAPTEIMMEKAHDAA